MGFFSKSSKKRLKRVLTPLIVSPTPKMSQKRFLTDFHIFTDFLGFVLIYGQNRPKMVKNSQKIGFLVIFGQNNVCTHVFHRISPKFGG